MHKFNRIIIFGIGGIGFWLTWILVRMYGRGSGMFFDIFDPDNFEGGTGDQRLPKTNRPKLFKVDLCAMQVRNIMGETPTLTAHPKKLEAQDLVNLNVPNPEMTLLIDTSDAPRDERQPIWDKARELGFTVIRGSYDGRTETEGGIAVVADSLPFQATGDNGGGYHSVPTIAMSFLAAGLLGEVIEDVMRTGVVKNVRVEIPVTPPPVQEVAIGVGE